MFQSLSYPLTRPARGLWLPVLLLGLSLSGGCAAFTNPVAEGVPVRRLPPELLGRPREEERPLPLPLLRQNPPEVYRLAPGDVLGVYIEGVLGERTQPPPVRYAEQSNVPPAFGYPLPVREDGTLPLPLIQPLKVQGMTIPEVQEAIRRAYTFPKEILKPGSERIVVTLVRPRTYHVLVVREDAGGAVSGQNVVGSFTTTATIVGSSRRGTGFALDLPAYENDVLNALARTGGLPGVDAVDEVVIQRGAGKGGWPRVMPDLDLECPQATGEVVAAGPLAGAPLPQGPGGGGGGAVQTLRIPLRLRPGDPITFSAEDVVLRDGDIVSIRARTADLFYTGGLLGTGEYGLPRDYDLRVVEAVARVRGPLVNGALNQNNFTGQVTNPGIGNPSPSLLSVVRHTAEGGQVVIRVDLNRALQDPRENILVQRGDVLILQETLGEAFVRYFDTNFRLNFLGTIIRQNDLIATTTLTLP
jgi:protein involved in polysaccharide export with SLBB domain